MPNKDVYVDDGIVLEDFSTYIPHLDVPEVPEEVFEGFPEPDLYSEPQVIDFRERPASTKEGYDEVSLVEQAEAYLNEHLGFLFGLGRVISVNHVKTAWSKTREKTIEDGSVIYTLRIVNGTMDRVLNMEVEIPIVEGKFVQPSVFKSNNTEYVLSPEGVVKAFGVSPKARIIFPDKRKSQRWPKILNKTRFF